MEDGLQIRPARQDDLQRLQDLYQHLDANDVRCSPDEAIGTFRKFLLYPGSAILLGAIGSELVTSCTLVVIPNLTRGGKPYALIENMVTHADWRKRGFGSTILKAATERAWDEGCYKVMIEESRNAGVLCGGRLRAVKDRIPDPAPSAAIVIA